MNSNNETKDKKDVWVVPKKEDYYFDPSTNSIRRNDLLATKKYLGDKSLTRKEIKQIQKKEKKARIRELKKHEK